MSNNVDNRIVQMSFKNEGFLSKVNETVKSLNILKTALNFSGVVKSEDLHLDTSQPEGAISKFIDKLGMLGDASQRVFSLVSGAMANVGHTIAGYAEDLSIGQMMPGFEKYAKDTKSVQTIMFATGESIENVEKELDKLMFFTDETSYSYENMVDNIGKFTSMKIPLDESRIAMQGIALAAAAAGQGSEQASRAMYNFAQAMGSGSVKVLDWASIENANMATAQLKQNAINAAIALGKLNEKGQLVTEVGTGKKKKKKVVTVDVENFRQTLSEGWFTKDVMMKVFSDYGEFAEKVQELVDKEGIETSEAIARLSGTTSDFAEKAYRAGQEATTFREAIDAVRDAASTKWLKIFKMVFGNYEEAKVTWTKLSNDLYEIFVTPMEGVVNLLSEWHNGIEDGTGSWNDFIQGAKDIMDGLIGIINTVKAAFSDIIPPITVEHLQKFSLAVKDLGAFLKSTFEVEEDGSVSTIKSTKKMSRAVQKADKEFKKFANSLYEIDQITSWLGETDDILKIGSKSEKDVRDLQKALKALGYDLGRFGVDGKFGAVTEAALNSFKRDMGLLENGILDYETSKTLQGAIEDHLGLGEATKSLEKFNRELSIGMRGDDVKLLQERLNSLGYIGAKSITGVFDKKTKVALGRFERDYGLVIDGIYSEMDHDLLAVALEKKVEVTKEAAKDATSQAESVVGNSKIFQILYNLSKGFASVLDIGRQIISTVTRIGAIFAKVFSPIADVVLSIALAFSDAAEKLDNYLKSSKVLEKFTDDLEKKLKPVADWVRTAADSFMVFFGLKEPLTDAEKRIHKFSRIVEYFKFVFQLSGFWDSVVKAFNRVKDAIKSLEPLFNKLGTSVSKMMGDDWVVTVINALGGFVQGFLEVAGYLIEVLGDLIGFIIESIPGAIGILEGFWNALFFAGDEKAGKAPGIITSIINWFKELFGVTTDNKEVEKYAKTGEGPITTVTKNLVGESKQGGKRVNKVLDAVKNIVGVIKKIFGTISLAFTGKVIEGSGLGQETIDKVSRIREWFARLFAAIGYIFSGKATDASLGKGFYDAATEFRTSVSNVFSFLKKTFGSIFAVIVYFINGKTFDNDNLKLGDATKERINRIKGVFNNIWNALIALFTGNVSEDVRSGITDKALWLRDKVIGIFSLLKRVFEGIFNAIGDFLGLNGASESTGVSGSVNNVSGFGNTIKGIFETVLNAISVVANSVINFIIGSDSDKADLSIGERLKEAIKKIGLFFAKIVDAIELLITGDASRNDNLSEETVNKVLKWRDNIINVINKISEIFGGLFSKIKTALGQLFSGDFNLGDFLSNNIGNKISEFISRIGSFFENIFGMGNNKDRKTSKKTKSIKEAPKDAGTFKRLLLDAGLALGGSMGAVTLITNIINKFKEAVGLIKPDKNKRGGLEVFAESLLKIAIAIGIIVAAIVVIENVKLDRITTGIKYLATIYGIIAGGSAIIRRIQQAKGIVSNKKKGGFLKTFNKISESILDIAKGVGILTAAILVLGKMKPETFLGGLWKLALVLGEVAVFLWGLKKIGFEKLDVKGFWDLAAGIFILSMAIKTLSDGTVNIHGVGAFTVILAEIAALMFVMGKFKATEINMKGFTQLAVAVKILAGVMKDLSDGTVNIDGIAALSVIMVEIGAIAAVMGHYSKSFKTLPMLVMFAGISAAIYLFGEAINKIKGVDPSLLYGFSVSLAIALGAFIAACSYVGGGDGSKRAKSMMKGAASIAASIGIFVGILGGIAAALGGLDELTNGGVLDAIKRGGEILTTIGGIMKSFQESLGPTMSIVFAALVGISAVGGKFIDPLSTIGAAAALGAAIDILIIEIGGLVAGLGKLDEWTNGGLSDAIDKGGKVLESFSTAIARLGNGFTKVFNEDIQDFGKAMESVRTGVEGVSGDNGLEADMEAAKAIASDLHDFFKDLEPYSLDGSSEFLNGYATVASNLSEDVRAFGEAIGTLVSGITNISVSETLDADIDISIGIVKSLKEKFFDVIGNSELAPNAKGIKDYNNKVTTVVEQVQKFGEKIKSFHDSVKGFSDTTLEADSNSAVSVAGVVADFLSKLSEKSATIEKDKSALSRWFSGGTTSETVFDTLGKLAKSINDSKDSFAGLSESTIETDVNTASRIAMAVVNLLSVLGGEDVQKSISSGLGSFKSMSKVFTDNKFGLGTILKAFADQIQNVDTLPEVSDIVGGFEKLAESLASNTGIKTKFEETGKAYCGYIIASFNSGDVSSVSDVIDNVLNILDTYKKDFETLGKNFINGLVNGVTFNTYLAEEAADYAASRMRYAVEQQLKINSPSKVGAELGKYFVEGLSLGIGQNANVAEQSASSAAQGMITVAQSTLATLYQLLSEGIDAEPTITPVVDLTNVRNAAGEISSTLGGQTYATAVTSQNMVGRANSEMARPVDTTVNVDASLNSLSEKFNSAIDKLNSRLDTMTDDIANMQMYIDGNTLVGYVSPRVNRSLGSQATLARRLN